MFLRQEGGIKSTIKELQKKKKNHTKRKSCRKKWAMSDSSLRLFKMRTRGQTSLQATGFPLTFIRNYRKVNSSGSDYFFIFLNYNFMLVTGLLHFYNLRHLLHPQKKLS